MSHSLNAVDAFLAEQEERNLDQLKQFLRIPSISADSRFHPEMRRCAEFVADQLQQAGATAELVETAGFPVVYGEVAGPAGAPTVVVYGHYDVQPPDPLEDWVTPPFEPDVRDDHIYARGATDDKGQLFTHIKSLEAWMQAGGGVPVNLKYVIEGEEEVGSDHLDQFLSDHRERLAADVAVISDTSQYAPGIPAITYGLRGILVCEVVLRGPSQDLHSGVFGGSISNPANALAAIVGALIDESGRVQVPGFYDEVIALTPEEREQFAKLPFDESAYLASLGVEAAHGEAGYTTLERRWARPTCDVNGFVSGYTGEGPKTIVPSWARVKLSCRLVPDQSAARLIAALRKFFEDRCPAGLKLEFHDYHGCEALVFDTSSPWMNAAQTAITGAFGNAPVFIREGGSIPVVSTFKEILGVDTLLLGWGQNTDNLHSPNEKFCVSDFHRGTRASAHLWYEMSRQ